MCAEVKKQEGETSPKPLISSRMSFLTSGSFLSLAAPSSPPGDVADLLRDRVLPLLQFSLLFLLYFFPPLCFLESELNYSWLPVEFQIKKKKKKMCRNI